MSTGNLTSGSLTAGNLFVVDDEELILNSVKAVLNHAGYQPKCYLSGEHFLSDATLDEPGCVITDLKMPGMDGVRLQQHLNEIQSPLSVIVLSGNADVPTVVNMMRKGAFTLLEKPYSSNESLSLTASLNRSIQPRPVIRRIVAYPCSI